MPKKIVKFFAKPLGILTLLVSVGALTGIYFFTSGEDTAEFVVAQKRDLVEEVSATGRVKPAASVNLAFDRSGRTSRVLVEVGDAVFAGQVLVQIANADLAAQLAETEASAEAQKAKLDEIKRGTRLEEVEVQSAKVNDARQTLNVRIQDAYTKSDDAIRNKNDQFFSNPRSANPTLNLSADSSIKSQIEAERLAIESLLLSWKSSLAELNSLNLSAPASTAKENLQKIKSFLDKVSLVVNALTSNTSISQTTIDGYKSDISTGRSNIEIALLNLSAAETNLLIQERELALKQASPLPEKIANQEAIYREALAKVDNIKAQIEKTLIRSPLNGTITKVDIKAGEIVAASTAVISVISRDTLQIEVNIPEADVAKIKIGQTADVTLDAYGNDETFPAAIVTIDPAETIVEGVATYKTTLQFSQQDNRIKSGMTANLDIVTDRRTGVIAVPQRVVFTQNGDKKIRVINKDGSTEERKVSTGLRGSDGNIEITAGLKEGEKIALSE